MERLESEGWSTILRAEWDESQMSIVALRKKPVKAEAFEATRDLLHEDIKHGKLKKSSDLAIASNVDIFDPHDISSF